MHGAHTPLQIELASVPNEVQWETCRQTQAGSTFFHRWDWLHIMATAFDSTLAPLGFYQGADLIGIAPLLVRRRGPYKRVNALPFPYLGPLLPMSLLPQGLTALDRYQHDNSVSTVELSFSPQAHVDALTLEHAGYNVQARTTFILPLAGRSEDDLWVALKDRRWNIRQARRAGVTIESASETEVREELPSIMDDVFATRRMQSPYPMAVASLVWQRYRDHPDVHMAAARHEGQTAGVIVTVIDHGRAYMWFGSCRSRFHRVNASALLYWDAICWARNRGCDAIDMVGSPDDGVRNFKVRFGALSKPFLVAQREYSYLIRHARVLRDYVRRRSLMGRLGPSDRS